MGKYFFYCSLLDNLWVQIVDPKTGVEKPVTISVDDGIRPNANLSDLAKLRPAFKKDGSTTAGKIHNPQQQLHFILFSAWQISRHTKFTTSHFKMKEKEKLTIFCYISLIAFFGVENLLCYCVLGNASQVSDGAGAVLLMKRSVAMQKGLPILGVFRY